MLRAISFVVSGLLLFALLAAGGTLFILWHYGRDLPDYRQLADYRPPVMTRVHAADGSLITEYARERRLFVPIAAIPRQVIQAFLSAEDKTFYTHPGLDFMGIAAAVVRNVRSYGTDRRPVGASTITQQVAKNFLLSSEVSVTRKLKEAILAFRIEHAFEKDRILELYLNEIYLGFGSYGVAAAALNYFNKSLDELSLPEAAFLAALPKAPNNYHPMRRPAAAVARRDWVLTQMHENDVISTAELEAARAVPLTVRRPDRARVVEAAYFAEEVRRQLVDRYGEGQLYEGGLSVRTTLEPRLQEIAERVLRAGLRTYDRRHGWRGPMARVEPDRDPIQALREVPVPADIGDWYMGVVLAMDKQVAEIGFANEVRGVIPMAEMNWARAWRKGQTLGKKVSRPDQVLAVGDVVAVSPIPQDAESYVENGYRLEQIPDVNGAIVAMDPHTGRVLAMVGGYAFGNSEFNRATQARRQPGSAFKPFVYAAALDHEFTPSSLVLDAPLVVDQGPALGKWKPANYSRKFYGPSTLRLGIEKSRNLMTVRLAQYIGMETVADYARRFGVVDDMPLLLPMALGAAETTLLRITAGYAILVNGGKSVTPTLVDRIQDRRGATIYRHDDRPCPGCVETAWALQAEPEVPDTRAQVVTPATAYQVVSMLRGVVERGTGRRVAAVGKPLAGKTGTSNEARDTWFMGFGPDLAVGVYVGFDTPRTLGRRESGTTVASPIFRDFMADALAEQPAIPFRIPPGIRLVRVDSRTGIPARAGDRNVILEAFKPGTEPSGQQTVLDGGAEPATDGGGTPRAGVGGLY